MAGNSADPGRSVTSKVVAILLTFTTGSTYSLTELARLAGLSVSTAYRLTTELVEWGVLKRADDGQYRVGTHLKVLCGRASCLPPTTYERATAVLEDLGAACGSADVRLGVLADLEVAFIEKAAGSRTVSMSFEAASLPAHATAMGKAILAFSAPRLVDMVIARGLKRYTPHTLTTADDLRRCLSVTRLTRIAVARSELHPASTAVAAPVFAAGGEVVAALELHSRDLHDLRLMRPPLIVAARSLSRELAMQHTAGQSSDTDLPSRIRANDMLRLPSRNGYALRD
jgi:DNA-binding IclR family transcriptional regulator